MSGENKCWYYVNDGKKVGPFSNEDIIVLIKNRIITSRTVIGHKKLGGWKKIIETEFASLFEKSPFSKQSRIPVSKTQTEPTSKSSSAPPIVSDVTPPVISKNKDSREWYYSDDGSEKVGPLSYEKMVNLIRNGIITSETFVYCKKFSDWKKADETEFQQFLDFSSPPPLPSANLPQVIDVLPPLPVEVVSSQNTSNSRKRTSSFSILGNILWFIFGGFLSGLIWFIAGLIWCVTIIGIPFGMQCFKFMSLSFFPFGKEIVYGGGTISLVANIIWLVFFGLWMAIANAIVGCLWCITIIGIPFGLQFFKIAKLSLMPFGAKIV